MHKIVDHSFNLWNEKWELGAFNTNTGEKVSSDVSLRSADYIPIVPNITYYLKCNPVGARLYFYNSSKTYLSTMLANNSTFTSPNNAYYMMFNSGNAYTPITSYQHDICLNISNPSVDGNYYPYYNKKLCVVDGSPNLFNMNAPKTETYASATISGTRITITGTYYCSWEIDLEANKSYYISFKLIQASSSNVIRFQYDDNSLTTTFNSGASFLAQQHIKRIYIYCSGSTIQTAIYDEVIINISNPSINGNYYPYAKRAKYIIGDKQYGS